MKRVLNDLLAQGKTAQVLAQLRSLSLSDSDLAGAIIQTSARFAEMERQQHAGTLAQDDLGVERNKINAAVLNLIENLPDDATSAKSASSTSDGKTVIQNADKIYNIQHIDKANFS